MEQDLMTYLWLLLILLGAGVWAIRRRPKTAAVGPVRQDVIDLFRAVARGDLDDVRLLIEAGVPIDCRDSANRTPLILAAENELPEMVGLLLSLGADVEQATANGWTPLMWAARNGSGAAVDTLLKAGADVHAVDPQGFTALHLAVQHGERSITGSLLDQGADINAPDGLGWNVLLHAIEFGNSDLIEFLLLRGVDVHVTAKDGTTALSLGGQHLSQDLPVWRRLLTLLNKEDVPPKPKRRWGWLFVFVLPALASALYWWFWFSSLPRKPGVAERVLRNEAAFVSIEAESFPRGCTDGDNYCDTDTHPQRWIQLSGYQLAEHEVSSGEYAEFIRRGGEHAEGRASFQMAGPGISYPAVNVSWYDAIAYCNWRSVRDGLEPVYSYQDASMIPVPAEGASLEIKLHRDANGYRLPTEAEWEHAARGRFGEYLYPWGNGEPGGDARSQVHWGGGGASGSAAVGSSDEISVMGCRDMAGNVSEWVMDTYDADYYGNGPDRDPVNLRRSGEKVYRGGNWRTTDRRDLRNSVRFKAKPTTKAPWLGFRLARNQPVGIKKTF